MEEQKYLTFRDFSETPSASVGIDIAVLLCYDESTCPP